MGKIFKGRGIVNAAGESISTEPAKPEPITLSFGEALVKANIEEARKGHMIHRIRMQFADMINNTAEMAIEQPKNNIRKLHADRAIAHLVDACNAVVDCYNSNIQMEEQNQEREAAGG